MKRLVSLFLMLALLVSLSACGSVATDSTTTGSSALVSDTTTEPEDTSGPQYGGTATIYYPKFYNYFDPGMMDEYQFSFWYESLWVLDWSLNDPEVCNFDAGAIPLDCISGQIAKDDYEFDEAAGTLTVHLRDDVYFQDGEPYNGRKLVADDVVWSYSRLLGLNGMAKLESEFDWARVIGMLAGIKATDESTVVFTFNEGMANTIALTSLMNAKVNIAGHEWETCPQTWEYAKGTGPYILAEYVTDNSMKLVRNDKYYDTDERYPENKLPYIDTINLVYIADSSNVLAQAMSGSLDWFGENGKSVLNNDQISQLADKNTGTLYPYLSSSPAAIALKVCQEQFSDIRVRQAMQYAIDLEAANIYLGNESDVVVPGLWNPALPWSTVGEWPAELLEQYEYNPEKAKALLADAGYANGFSFDLELDPTSNLELYQLAADYLKQVGITVNITVAAEMMEAVQHSQDYADVRQSAGFGGGFPEYMLAVFMTGNGMFPNAYGHTDQAYLDKLGAMGMAKDVDEEAALGRELDQMFPAAHWAILVGGMQPTYDFMSSRIGGYSGEKVYYRQNMRTIWSRLWINE